MEVNTDKGHNLLRIMGLSSLIGFLYWYIQNLLEAPVVEWLSVTIRSLSFFTNLTNALIVIMVWALLSGKGRLYDFFKSPSVQSACCLYIAFVGLGFWGLLGGPEVSNVLDWIPEITAHTFSPIMGAVYWFFAVPKRSLSWIDPVKWLLYPIAYLIFWLFRGPLVGYYPYFFIDVDAMGYSGVALWTSILIIAYLLLGFGMRLIDRGKAS